MNNWKPKQIKLAEFTFIIFKSDKLDFFLKMEFILEIDNLKIL